MTWGIEMGKRYKSVSEMLHDVPETKELAKQFDKDCEERLIVGRLFAYRQLRGMSQGYVAKAMGCSKEFVAEIENSKDCDVLPLFLFAYAEAVNMDLPDLLDIPDADLRQQVMSLLKSLDEDSSPEERMLVINTVHECLMFRRLH